MNILIMLDKLCVRDFGMKYYIIEYAIEHMEKFRKITYMLFENVINVYSRTSTDIIDIGAKQYALPKHEYTKHLTMIIHMIDYANMVMTVLTETLTSDDELMQIIMSDDIIDIVTQFFAVVFYNFKDVYIANDWVFDKMHKMIARKDVDMKSYIYSIIALFCKIYNNCDNKSQMHDQLVKHSINHDAMIERVTQMINYIDLSRFENSECTTILSFIENLKNHKIDVEIEYPMDLIDPFLAIPIKNPLVLPSTNTIVDKKSIQLQMFSNEQHPLTREPMTLQDVIEYSEGVGKVHIIEFNKKMDQWKKDNNLI